MATLAPPPPALVTDEQYLARERDPKTRVRGELLYGEVSMMAGGSNLHANLPTQLFGLAYGSLQGSDCEAFSSDMKVRIPGAGYLYPDASFACDPIFEASDVLLNPLTVVEVLSPTTERRDRTDKFDAYGLIPSLREIVLVATEERRVEVYRRDGDEWRLRISGPGDTARLLDGRVELPLDRLYANFERFRAAERAGSEPTPEPETP